MATAARTVANLLISLAKAKGKLLTPLQLMKLVYISHGWTLAILGRPLVTNTIEAWQYGPVIPDLYQQTKKYGSGSVIEEIPPPFWAKSETPLDNAEKQIIQQVYDVYGSETGIQLSAMTHKSGTPWDLTWASGRQRNAEISNDLIAEHYRKLSESRASN